MMAYMSQKRKKELAVGIREVLKAYGVKGTIAVNNGSTLVVNLKSGAIDFKNSVGEKKKGFGGQELEFYHQVNTYHIDSQWTGEARDFLTLLKEAMMVGNHDNSDIMTDYFDVGWYVDINVGRWNKEYELAA